MTIYEEALSFGFSPIPLNGKIPITSDWTNKETGWFLFALEKHKGNIGIRTGKWSKIIILDCDLPRKNNPSSTNGNVDFANIYFDETGYKNPLDIKTVIDISGSGSYRFYFRYEGQFDYDENFNKKYRSKIQNTNIDILANNKVAVYPGSIYSGCCGKLTDTINRHKCETNNINECLFKGNKYRWVEGHSPHEIEISRLPDWLEKYVYADIKPLETKTREVSQQFDDDILEHFQHLKSHRFEDFHIWRDIIWLACKMGLNDDDIQKLSSQASNYDSNSTQQLISDYDENKNNMTISSLMFYLREDDEKYFKSIITKQKQSDNAILLEDINPDETINQNDIGDYQPRLNEYDVVCIRSNMMTYKTQNIKKLLRNCKSNLSNTQQTSAKVLVVTFRVSLALAYAKELEDFNFKLYNEHSKRGVVKENRIICQIDSLSKVKGEFDFLILDEWVYTLDHLCSFVKRKTGVWSALLEHIRETPKIIVSDALLSRQSINLFKELDRKVLVVENKWQSFSGKKAEIVKLGSNGFEFIDFVEKQLKKGLKLACPTNSKAMGEKLSSYISKKIPNCKIGIISQDTQNIQVEMWNQYDCLIYTPSVVAGLSFNKKYYDQRVAYFTSRSCSAEMATQMLFRIRNSKLPTRIYIASSSNNFPETNEEIDKYLETLDNVENIALYKSVRKNKIIQDEYYRIYRDHLMRINKSKNNFIGILRGILEHHGIECIFQDNVREKSNLVSREEREKFTLNARECKKIFRDKKLETYQKIVDAELIDIDDAMIIKRKNIKTEQEIIQLRKFYISNTYNKKDFDVEFVKKFEGLTSHFFNLREMNRVDFTEHSIHEIKTQREGFDEFTKSGKTVKNTDRLHENKNMLKRYVVDKLVKISGFENIWDIDIVNKYNYKGLYNYLSKNYDNITTLFGSTKRDFSKIDINTSEGKKYISRFVNDRLTSVCQIKISKTTRKGKCTNYKISGLNIWEEAQINLEKNIDISSKKPVIKGVMFETPELEDKILKLGLLSKI